MRNAETLLGIIRERGRRGLPLERVYRLLFNRDLYLLAYGRIARNRGRDDAGRDGGDRGRDVAWRRSMPSSTPCASSGIGGRRCGGRTSRRRNGKTAPARASRPGRTSCCRRCSGSSWTPTTSRSSPTTPTASGRGRGCHTALREVYHAWPGTAWFIELDVAQFFDRLDHEVLLGEASWLNASTTAVCSIFWSGPLRCSGMAHL